MSDRPLSVCMFTNLYPPVVSGSSTQVRSLARELVQRGCKVSVITAKVEADSADYECVDGVHVHRMPAVRLPRMPLTFNFPWLTYTFTPGNLRRIREILERDAPDVLHLHNHMFDLSLAAVLFSKRKKIPLVVTIHTILKHKSALFNLLLFPVDRFVLKPLVVGRAAAVICPDVNIEDYVHAVFRRTGTHIIPLGIDIPEAPGAAMIESIRTKHRLEGRRVILSVGHVHAIRNRKDIIEALPDVLAEHPNAVLLIVGFVGDDLPVKLARKLGVQDAVIFAGSVAHSEIYAYLALSDMEAHWLNQNRAEETSLGIASMEAMAAGKVVLAAIREDTYGPNVLRSGENFVLVEPGRPNALAHTINALLKDDAKRQAIGRRAKSIVEEFFSWDSVCEKTLQVYRQTQSENP